MVWVQEDGTADDWGRKTPGGTASDGVGSDMARPGRGKGDESILSLIPRRAAQAIRNPTAAAPRLFVLVLVAVAHVEAEVVEMRLEPHLQG